MKTIQAALDLKTTKETLEILEKISDKIDIIELGTPLVVSEGTSVIEEVKKRYEDKIIFADIKIMDGGSIMAKLVFEAGADMVSVLAAANDETIEDVVKTAREYNKKVLIDMVAIKDIEKRAKELEHLKPDYICVHIGTDVQAKGVNPVEEIKKLKDIKIKKAAAGGINLLTFKDAVNSDIDNIIVGSAMYGAEDPCKVASEMRRMLNEG